MLSYISGAVRASLVTFVLCGFAYPFAVTGVGQLLMPDQANGSLEKSADGKIIGSRLIGQQWSDPQWFHGRLSATMDLSDSTKAAPYNAANTSASNLGPTSKALQDRLTGDRKALEQAQPELAGKALPSDVLTTSASGLDPDITPANASLQAPRVAKARGAPPEQVAALVEQHTTSRSLGIFGEPRVNVLELNLALDKTFPMGESRESTENPSAAKATPGPSAPAPVAAAAEPPASDAAESAATAIETPNPDVVAAPLVNPLKKLASKSAAIFPSEISPAHAGEKPGMARLRTCSDQFHANAATNSNGGLKWMAYWKECKKHLKG